MDKHFEQNREMILLFKKLLENPQTVLVNHLPSDLREDLPSLVNDLPEIVVPTALPSKDELAKKWLLDHPEDVDLTGRELEKIRRPMDVKISYVTWNKIKKEFK